MLGKSARGRRICIPVIASCGGQNKPHELLEAIRLDVVQAELVTMAFFVITVEKRIEVLAVGRKKPSVDVELSVAQDDLKVGGAALDATNSVACGLTHCRLERHDGTNDCDSSVGNITLSGFQQILKPKRMVSLAHSYFTWQCSARKRKMMELKWKQGTFDKLMGIFYQQFTRSLKNSIRYQNDFHY